MRRLFLLPLALIVLAAACLRMHCLGCAAFDQVEADNVLNAASRAAGYWRAVWQDGYPPLVAPLLGSWAALAGGHDEFTLRLPAMLFGILSVAMAAAAARRLFDPPTALIAALLLALAVLHVRFSQYAGGHSPAVFFGLASLYFWLRLPGISAEAAGTRSALDKACFVAAASLFLTLHNFAFVVFAAFVLEAARRRGPQRRELLLLLALPLALAMPALAGLTRRYLEDPNIGGLPLWPVNLSWCFRLFNSGSQLLAALFANLVLWGVFVHLRRGRGAARLRLPLLWCIAPAIAAFAYGLVNRSFFLPETFVLVLPAYLMLVAYGIRMLPWRGAVFALLACIAAAAVPELRSHYRGGMESEALRRICTDTPGRMLPGDLLLHAAYYSFSPCLAYHGAGLEEYYLPSRRPTRQRSYARPVTLDLEQAARFRRVWIVSYPKTIADEAAAGLLEHPAFRSRGAEIAEFAPDRHLLLLALTGPQQGR